MGLKGFRKDRGSIFQKLQKFSKVLRGYKPGSFLKSKAEQGMGTHAFNPSIGDWGWRMGCKPEKQGDLCVFQAGQLGLQSKFQPSQEHTVKLS